MSTAKPGDEDNLKLLGAIPASARRILELGCGAGALGRLFKQLRPGVQWWGVDASADALRAAAPHLEALARLRRLATLPTPLALLRCRPLQILLLLRRSPHPTCAPSLLRPPPWAGL
jgi:SAM-dependent methyltransferase